MRKLSSLRSVCRDGAIEVTFRGSEESSLTVYRRALPEYVFDQDYAEYFDGIYPDKTDVIFEGKVKDLPCEHGFYCFRDESAVMNEVYLYWIASEAKEGQVTGPVPVKFRDPEVWWNFDRIQREMELLAAEFPEVTLTCVGETVAHKPVNALVAGNCNNMVACVGVIHAGESGPELLIPMMRTILEEHQELLEKVGLAILPVVNADERERLAEGYPCYLRTNKNGVDLNRNFDADWETVSYAYNLATDDERCSTYRGPYPESEPETRAVINFIKLVKPKISFNYHHLASITGDGFLRSDGPAKNEAFLAEFEKLVRIYRTAFRKDAGDLLPEQILSPGCTGGSLPEWLSSQGIMGTDLEMAYDGTLGPYLEPSKRDETTQEMLERCADCHTKGVIAVMKALSE